MDTKNIMIVGVGGQGAAGQQASGSDFVGKRL